MLHVSDDAHHTFICGMVCDPSTTWQYLHDLSKVTSPWKYEINIVKLIILVK